MKRQNNWLFLRKLSCTVLQAGPYCDPHILTNLLKEKLRFQPLGRVFLSAVSFIWSSAKRLASFPWGTKLALTNIPKLQRGFVFPILTHLSPHGTLSNLASRFCSIDALLQTKQYLNYQCFHTHCIPWETEFPVFLYCILTIFKLSIAVFHHVTVNMVE